MEDARRVAERVARDSYGRLVALIAARTRDITAAEDALAEALCAALEHWPRGGVPERPEAWLLTAARRAFGHVERHGVVRDAAALSLTLIEEEMAERQPTVTDKRLHLMFVCAHPAIDPAARTPLMLQTVLGIDAARIAAAFVTRPATMAQRLVRAKGRIRDAGIGFDLPPPEAFAERLDAVLDAIYAAFGLAWDDERATDLGEEALFLARLVVELMPDAAEARGLLALMLYCEARAKARRRDGRFVPLAEQDVSLWSGALIVEAEDQLTRAAALKQFGRYQTEAAIQSVHCQRAITGATNHAALVTLYDLLARHEPTLGILIGRAAAYGAARGPDAGLKCLAAIEEDAVRDYQPYWATRAHLLMEAGQPAAAAFDRAIGLSSDTSVRAYLSGKKQGDLAHLG